MTNSWSVETYAADGTIGWTTQYAWTTQYNTTTAPYEIDRTDSIALNVKNVVKVRVSINGHTGDGVAISEIEIYGHPTSVRPPRR